MPKRSAVLAIDLGGTKVCVAIVDREGVILARRTEPVDKSLRLAPVSQMVRLAFDLITESPNDLQVSAAGVVVPGLVRQDGAVWAPNIDGWKRIALGRMLQERLGFPVAVDSDRAGAVLGEVFSPKGAAHGKSDVVSIIMGTGIGAGILVGGKLARGAHRLSGCAGWMAVAPQSPTESGGIECLETFVSGPGLVRLASAAIEAGLGGRMSDLAETQLTSYHIAQLAREGDQAAQMVWSKMAQLLGMAVATVISLFDPEVVVIGGGFVQAADCFWREMKHVALKQAQPLAAKQVKIMLSRLGNDANLLGASYLGFGALQSREGERKRRTSSNDSRLRAFSISSSI